MEPWQIAIVFTLVAYIALCFGLIAKWHGLNPWVWGAVSVVSPINLLALGYWAASGHLPTLGRVDPGDAARSDQ